MACHSLLCYVIYFYTTLKNPIVFSNGDKWTQLLGAFKELDTYLSCHFVIDPRAEV